MRYAEFEDALLVAIVAAADNNQRGQADVTAAAEGVLPGVSEQWISSAVKSYERAGWVYNVSRPLQGGITLMVTGAGRRHAA